MTPFCRAVSSSLMTRMRLMEQFGDGLLGHIFKVIIPCGLDHQRILVMNGVIHGCSVSHRKNDETNFKMQNKSLHKKYSTPNKADVNSFAK